MRSLLLYAFIISLSALYAAGCENSDNQKIVTVGNGNGNINNPPAAPSNPNPPNNDTGISNLITLSWSCSDPDAGDTVRYDVYLDNVDPPAQRVVANYLPTIYGFGIVNHNLRLYWKVIARDTKGATTSSPVWTFRTAP